MVDLPVEIWQNILRWVTWVPYALNTELPDYFAYPPPPSQDEIQENLLRLLPTKNSLTQVCKGWNTLATPFLYEAVLVRSPRAFRILRETLEDSAATCGVDRTHTGLEPMPLGHRVKRVDIAFTKGVQTNLGDYFKLDWDFALLPNLEIFVSRKRGVFGYHGSEEFLPTPLPAPLKVQQLRIVDISHYLKPEKHTLSGLIENNPKLRQLHCSSLVPIIGYHAKEKSLQVQLWNIYFHLFGPRIGNPSEHAIYASMPSLRHFICHQHCIAPEFDVVLSICGLSVETLELEIATPHLSIALPLSLADASRYCPRLRNVIINLFDFAVLFPTALADFPSVENVGLRLSKYRRRCKRAEINMFFSHLLKIAERTGTIKVVRILDHQTYDYLTRDHLPSIKYLSSALSLSHRAQLEGPAGKTVLK